MFEFEICQFHEYVLTSERRLPLLDFIQQRMEVCQSFLR